MREIHHLKEDPTEPIKDYDLLLTQLDRLKSAREIVINETRPQVPARSKHSVNPEPQKESESSTIQSPAESLKEKQQEAKAQRIRSIDWHFKSSLVHCGKICGKYLLLWSDTESRAKS